MEILYSNIQGKGKPLLILHGFLGMGDNWKTLANSYANEGYEVHLIDQRNHGRSFHSEAFTYKLMVQDLKNYCDHHQITDMNLIGHSMGGKTAMMYASEYQNFVKKLIVVDIAPKSYPQHHQDILKGLSSLNFSTMNSRGDAENQLKQYVSNLGIRQFLLKNLYRKTQNEFALRLNLPALIKNIEEIGEALPENAIYEGPALFMKGERSGYIESMDEIAIQKQFPKASFVTIPNSGHWLHAENPEAFFEETLRFLR